LSPTTQPEIADADTVDPCARHPEVENDNIGMTATLDQDGYRRAAETDSPINMKRFICRTIAFLGCRATDMSALMGFVTTKPITFSRLEYELKTLCRTGGNWVVPLGFGAL